jgi:hypothetical protein
MLAVQKTADKIDSAAHESSTQKNSAAMRTAHTVLMKLLMHTAHEIDAAAPSI